jgi:hypothetical protein
MRLRRPAPPDRDAFTPSVKDVRKKVTARAVVARLRKVAAPRPPKRVWLEPAPNVPASPPPFPDCSRMAAINPTQTTT